MNTAGASGTPVAQEGLMSSTTTTVPAVVRVDIKQDSSGIVVWPFWSGDVDRPEGVGYAVSNMHLAERMKTAMLAGAVFYDAEVRTDVNGKTYVSSRSRVLGRQANADLRRLGY
jgi:hypothetical protein